MDAPFIIIAGGLPIYFLFTPALTPRERVNSVTRSEIQPPVDWIHRRHRHVTHHHDVFMNPKFGAAKRPMLGKTVLRLLLSTPNQVAIVAKY